MLGVNMTTIHHIAMRIRTEQQREEFRAQGFDLKGSFVSFEIGDDDPRWPAISGLIKRHKVIDTAITRHSDAELSAARVAGLWVSSARGYPEPSNNFGYLAKTFDLTGYCNLCGVGGKQTHAFRLKVEPKAGRTIFKVNWVHDEFFVDVEVWRNIFKTCGVDCRPAVLHGKGTELPNVVQLIIDQTVDVNVDELKMFKDCRQCGRRKYSPK